MPRRHVLIGSGPASISAAESIRSRDSEAEIVVVSAEPEGYYSRPGLAYYLAKEVPETQIFPCTREDIAKLGVRFVFARATEVEPAAHVVRLETGQALDYDRLLLATGSLAIPLRVPGAELDGVVKLDDIHDARDLIHRSRAAKAAVVVGGGITALEITEGLREHGVHVHYFMRKDRYWSNVLSEPESEIVEKGLRDRGVEIHYFTELAEVLGGGGRVTGVATEKGERIPCEIVAAAIGVLPQHQLAESAGLECGRGVLVDEHLRSSEPDIFAAGDIAEVIDPRSGQRAIEVLWSSAVAKGHIAGLNMATEPVNAYEKDVPLNVTRLAGFKITIIGTVGSGKDSDLHGIARGDSEVWRRLGNATSVETDGGQAHVRIELDEHSIAGALVMGDQSLSFPLQDLIETQADVGTIAEMLRAPGAPVAEIIHSFWREWHAQLA